MYDMEKVREYALEQEDWIEHGNGWFQLKECVFFYHKGQPVFNPWRDISGNFVDDPFAVYGKDKANEYCRRMPVLLYTDTESTPASASTEPTDRSRNPLTINSISPYAIRIPTHSCLLIFTRLLLCKKYGLIKLHTINKTTNTM